MSPNHAKRIKSDICEVCHERPHIPRSPYCQECKSPRNLQASARFKRRHKEDPDSTRRTNLRRRYGIELEDYNRLLTGQGGKCAICSSSDPKSKDGNFHVDHCHETKLVRGLLCFPCNAGIGKFRHDPALRLRAIAYINGGRTMDGQEARKTMPVRISLRPETENELRERAAESGLSLDQYLEQLIEGVLSGANRSPAPASSPAALLSGGPGAVPPGGRRKWDVGRRIANLL
jgi:hypothetical protein